MMPNHSVFSTLNYLVLGGYLILTVAIGLWFSGRQKSTAEYFLAGRNIPWLVVSMSMFATLVSAVTYMGTPGVVYSENVSIYVGILMMPLVSPFVIALFFPFYRRLNVTTSYEYILQRFGSNARYSVSALFVLARLGWLGTVIYAPALMLSVVTKIDIWQSILLIGLIATAYTAMGGLAAVIWTDALQFMVLVFGAVAVAIVLILMVPGGISGIIDISGAGGKLDVMNAHFNITEMSITGVAISYFLIFMHDFGVDQVSVQRLLATRSLKDMAWATIMNAVFSVVIVGILTFVGLGLFSYFSIRPDLLPHSVRGDGVFPYFVVHALPDGVSGLILAGIFAAAMSSLDSGINSLSTVIVNDFVRPIRGVTEDREDLNLARVLVIVFGTLATTFAFVASAIGNILESAQFFLGLFSGPVLALFLLGVLSTRTTFVAWMIGASIALPVTIALSRIANMHFTYLFPVAFGLSFTIGLVLSVWIRERAPLESVRGLTIWGLAESKKAKP